MKIKSLRLILISLFIFISFFLYSQEKLIFSVTIIRHGDRSPYDKMESSTIKYQWPDGIGELTPEGMHQEFLLGKKLRERYIDSFKLLSPDFKINSMLVISTNYNRTVMSALSFLAGFYPNGTGPKLDNGSPALPDSFQPVPILTISSNEKNFINPEKSNGKQYDWLMTHYSFTQPEWIKKNMESSSDFKRWSKILGVNIKDLNDLLVPADHVYCMYVHGIKLPEELTKEDIDKIIKLKMWAAAIRFVPKEMAYFMASPFFTRLSADMQSAAEGKQKYKYILYSGHDDSLLGIMSALGRPLENNPPYASHIDFEQYRNGSNYFVKIFYNDEPLKLSEMNREILNFREFQDLISRFIEK